MARRMTLAPALILSLLCSACGLSGAVDDVKQTASGALDEAQLIRDRAEGKVEQVQNRVHDVREGIRKIDEGQSQLRRGLTGSGS